MGSDSSKMSSDSLKTSSESSDLKTALKDVPIAINKNFPSNRASSIIKDDPRAVNNGRYTYQILSRRGKIMIHKQRSVGLERSGLQSIAKTIEGSWGIQNSRFRSYKMLQTILTSHWTFDSSIVEELELSPDGTMFLYYVIRYNSQLSKYNVAICYLKADTQLSREVMIAGLIEEHNLNKDEHDRLYLQL